ncbi:TetR/AcrR family transcriptional regulator [Devosia sp. CN2-171]|jgi:TetR/AcrR family transcriptional repressor of mexCD-oprJ operon|uniref:TetR/AcrR family transcriptional regulator n=1 Tax=Devosia sp. CN2-171 TaxID=3400909 RepID=UPI003BF879AB
MPNVHEGKARRADAVRNRDGILDAALELFLENPRANMAEIASAAGVGRVTLYGHFASRTELMDVLFERTVTRAEEQLSRLDLEGDPAAALERLVVSSWRIVDAFHRLLGAAEYELSPDRIREHHHKPMQRVSQLIARGRSEGAFRNDQPVGWLTACFYALLHTAASEVRTGRLAEADAQSAVVASIAAVLASQTA